ncbi:catalase family protein [Mycolicibacterium goodii]|uniref:catalase family protein n=1 Tax=Mycolicibacterium goodii TaxID=134601 RepID=UPI000C264F8D|nr:catalase family protein [Mycolicibacterium goodii]PJK19163.1 catalase [Mycolicibacterium goodii]ULN45523.1 catalase family protein [Mycolicibacterium goodii]
MTEAVNRTTPWKQQPIRYAEDLEKPSPREDADIQKIMAKLLKNNERAYEKYKHGLRDAHAKSHAILRGELIVNDGLVPELAQGLFAEPRSYPVIARLSSTSGVRRSDKTRGVRGLGLKVLGVQGPKILDDDTSTNQDFVLVTHEEFLFADAHAYAGLGMITASLLARLSDQALWLGSELLDLVSKVGVGLPENLKVFIAPNRPILGLEFFSSAPFRHGEYVAKYRYAPVSPNVTELAEQLLPRNPAPEAHRDMIAEFFADQTAEYELSAQLCTDPVAMPIEDARRNWDQAVSPYIPVARIVFGPQNPYSALRRAYGDDVLSFNSWRGLAEHRPLGSINRLKRTVYESSSNYRHRVNRIDRHEPVDISELPD